MAKHQEKPLSHIILRLLLASFSVVFLALMVLNFQSGYQAVKRETQHHFEQIDHLLHAVLGFQLGALRYGQDTSVVELAIHQRLEKQDASELDSYFSGLDENTPESSPDFRFIAMDHTVIWNDSNSLSLGLGVPELNRLIAERLPENGWHLRSVTTVLGENQILLRKAPVILPESGKVAAALYVAVVLNDNATLVQKMRQASGSKALMITYNGQVLASSIRSDDPDYLTMYRYITQSAPETSESDYLHKIPVQLKENISGLSFVILHSNNNIVTLKSQYLQSAMIGAALIIILAISVVYFFRRSTLAPLNQLVNYARNATMRHNLQPYNIGNISEFNRIGKAFEKTLVQLSEKERSLYDLFSFAFSPILVWDTDLTLQHINPAAKKCLGFHIKKSHSLNYFEQFERDAAVYLQQAVAGNIVEDIVLSTRQGRSFAWNMAPVIVNGKTTAVIAQGLDITVIKQAEEDSHNARLAAEEANRAKSAFLATMSHEIRTPLNGILGMAQIIQKTLTDHEQQQQMKVLYESGNHLLTLLSDILDFSKIEQGKLELNKVDFQLDDIIRSISVIYQSLCHQKGLTLEVCNTVDTPLHLFADDARIRQILFNLLSNAVKFTHSGTVKLTLELTGENDQIVNLRLIVSDTGIGVRKERIDKLFEPFVQAENSTTRGYGGSGLGLSIVKKLVELMDGEISVESTIGTGTVFEVQLALDKSHPAVQPEPGDNLYTVKIEGLDILVVEDNKINALVAKTFCEKQGHHVQCVQNGQQAVELVKKQDFDLILMDNHMPVMDGIEATKLIRNDLNRKTVIFAFTADAFQQTHDDFIAAGANAVLTKPLKEESLLQALQQNHKELLKRKYQQGAVESDNTISPAHHVLPELD
ncbi:ATP-binding protein [Photobacterium sagamiensis]|uniref:LuxQ periplasmic sensor domain-containing protein n=1 Tax=Photobacterium sagamiensis TaxID=2910241 RepID=UPI003D143D44